MPAWRQRVPNAVEVFWLPRSEWWMTRSGRRVVMAMSTVVGDQPGGHVVAHGPADYPPGPDIDHRRQVQEPGPVRNMGAVRHPDTIRFVGCELPAYQIGRRGLGRVLPGGRNLTAAVNPLDTVLAHQPRHPFSTHRNSLGGRLGVDQGSTVGAPRPGMDVHDPVPEFAIGLLPGRCVPVNPRVVATGRARPDRSHMRRTG